MVEAGADIESVYIGMILRRSFSEEEGNVMSVALDVGSDSPLFTEFI